MDRLLAMQIFARVAERGSFTQAASAVGLSRARVSEAVQALERALGARLLHRSTRRLSLTDDGRAYYERVRRILDDVAEADALVHGSRASPRGKLRVDMPVALGRLFVLPELPKLFKKHPGLELELRLENRSVDLSREGVDCAVTYGEPLDRELVARRIGSTHLVTCASKTYLARRGVPRTPEALTEHACVAFLGVATARPSVWEFSRNGARVTHTPRGSLAVNSMEACVDAAAAGLGVTQVLSSVAHESIRVGRLAPVLMDVAAEGPALYVAYPPNQQASARLRVFIDFVRELFSAMDADMETWMQRGRKRARATV
jgi:LysR family transcriptional regulator for bpeEF and oprC